MRLARRNVQEEGNVRLAAGSARRDRRPAKGMSHLECRLAALAFLLPLVMAGLGEVCIGWLIIDVPGHLSAQPRRQPLPTRATRWWAVK